MGRRWFVRGLVLAILAAFVVWLEPTRVIWGWLRGEAFYAGRPTSYWANAIRPWGDLNIIWWRGLGRAEAVRHPCIEWLSKFAPLPEPSWPSVLDGDPEAEMVLRELQQSVDSTIRDWAEEGLRRIETGDKGPTIYLFRPGPLHIPGGVDAAVF